MYLQSIFNVGKSVYPQISGLLCVNADKHSDKWDNNIQTKKEQISNKFNVSHGSDIGLNANADIGLNAN